MRRTAGGVPRRGVAGGARLLLAHEDGVCLAEFLVSLATGAVVLAGAFQAFTFLQAHAMQQQRALSHQQDVRIGLEVFEQEVRLATADAIVTASPEEFHFLANLHDLRTTLTGPIAPGQSVLPVLDGSGWAKGKTVKLCGPQLCENHSLAGDGQRLQLTLTEPVGSAFPTGGSVEITNRVVYYSKPDQRGVLRLMRMVDGGANVLVGELNHLRLSYWDEQGRRAQNPVMTKRVVMEMRARSSSTTTISEVSLRS